LTTVKTIVQRHLCSIIVYWL